MSFCVHCGTRLEEGVLCNCSGALTRRQAAAYNPPECSFSGICPYCNEQLQADNSSFCTNCGYSLCVVTAPKAPANHNPKAAANDLDSEVSSIFGISIQRIILAAASLLGLIACLLPWYRVSGMGVTVTANAFSISQEYIYNSESILNIFGVLAFLAFAAALALCFLGNRAESLGKRKFVFVGCGAVSVIILIVNIAIFGGGDYKQLSKIMSGGLGFGLFLALLMALVVSAIPFVKKLEN